MTEAAILIGVLAAWRIVTWAVARDRGRVHRETSYVIGGTLYVGPETYEHFRKLDRGDPVDVEAVYRAPVGTPVVVTDLCAARTGW